MRGDGLEVYLGSLLGVLGMIAISTGVSTELLTAAIIALALSGALWGLAQGVTRLLLPHEGEERAWAALSKAASSLEIVGFGGRAPPEGRMVRGSARVRIRRRGRRFTVRIVRGGGALAPELRLEGRRPDPAAPRLVTGDAPFDRAVTATGDAPEGLALLDEAVRGLALDHVAGEDVVVEPGRAVWSLVGALERPAATLARIDGLVALLDALAARCEDPPDRALEARAVDDAGPDARAAALRALFDYYPLTERRRGLARAAAQDDHPAIRWAAAGGLCESALPQDRLRGFELARAGLADGDAEARRHLVGVLVEAFPPAVVVPVLKDSLRTESGPLEPQLLRYLAEVGAEPEPDVLTGRLDVSPPERLPALARVLEGLAAHPGGAPAPAPCWTHALVHLAHHERVEVGLAALFALGRVGSLDAVAPLLALSRAARSPARRGAALRVARRIQAERGQTAVGALSWPIAGDGRGALSPSRSHPDSPHNGYRVNLEQKS